MAAQAKDDVRVEVIGQYGGQPGVLALGGQYLYAVVGDTIQVLDTADRSLLRLVGRAHLAPTSWPDIGKIEAIAAAGHTLYVVTRMTSRAPPFLLVLDATDPRQPREVGRLILAADPSDLEVGDGYVFVGLRADLALVIDVRQPVHPHLIAELPLPAPSISMRIALVGRTLVVAPYEVPVHVFDVTDPARPILAAMLDHGALNVAALAGSFAVLDTESIGVRRPARQLELLDLAEPQQPRIRAIVDVQAGGRSATDGDRVYLWGPLLTRVYRLVGARLESIGAFLTPSAADDPVGNPEFAFAGDRAFVAMKRLGLVSVDVTEPASAVRLAELRWTMDIGPFVTDGRYAFAVTDGYSQVQVLAVGRPDDIHAVASIPITGNSLALAGTRLVLGTADAGGRWLQVYDVAVAARPVRLGGVAMPSAIGSLAVTGNLALAIGPKLDLTIVDLGDGAAPRIVGSLAGTGLPGARALAVAGNVAFMSSSVPQQVVAVDLSDPTVPRRIGSLVPTDTGNITALQLRASLLYVASEWDEPSGLTVIDVHDPVRMVQLGSVTVPGIATGLAVAGHYAVPALDYAGLGIVDVSDPHHPRDLGGIDPRGGIDDVAVADCRLFYVDHGLGLVIALLTAMPTPTTPAAAAQALHDGPAVYLPYIERAPPCLSKPGST